MSGRGRNAVECCRTSPRCRIHRVRAGAYEWGADCGSAVVIGVKHPAGDAAGAVGGELARNSQAASRHVRAVEPKRIIANYCCFQERVTVLPVDNAAHEKAARVKLHGGTALCSTPDKIGRAHV